MGSDQSEVLKKTAPQTLQLPTSWPNSSSSSFSSTEMGSFHEDSEDEMWASSHSLRSEEELPILPVGRSSTQLPADADPSAFDLESDEQFEWPANLCTQCSLCCRQLQEAIKAAAEKHCIKEPDHMQLVEWESYRQLIATLDFRDNHLQHHTLAQHSQLSIPPLHKFMLHTKHRLSAAVAAQSRLKFSFEL